MDINNLNARITPTFDSKEPVEEVREARKLVSYYSIEPGIDFSVYDDEYMEMEYRGEEPTDPEDPCFSIRREQIFPNTERYKEILEIIKDMVPAPSIYDEPIPRFPKRYITKEVFEKTKKLFEIWKE